MSRLAVLVLGSSGFIGGFVVAELLRRGHYVIGVDRIEPGPGATKPSVFVKGDVLDLSFIESIMGEYSPDAVVNLVGIPHIPTCERNPHLSYMVNVVTAHNILEAMRSFGAKRYIFASTAAVYGDRPREAPVSEEEQPAPTSIYGWHKLEAELEARGYAERYGLEALVLRLFNVYGADPLKGYDVASIFLRSLVRGETLRIIDPHKVRDFVYVEDVARAFAAAAEARLHARFAVVNVGTGRPVTIMRLLQVLAAALGVKPSYVVERDTIRGGYYADTSKMRKLLGVDPVSLEEGVEKWLTRLGLRAGQT